MLQLLQVIAQSTPKNGKKDRTSVERLRNYRKKIYTDKESHSIYKGKDAMRKRISRASAAELIPIEKEEKKRKAREPKGNAGH